MILRTFGWSFGVTVIGLAAALWYGGPAGLAVAAILIVLEVSLSFDNAVVNARVLVRMSEWWQTIFLTVGILIAVFGMRLVFPLVVVGITADLSPARAWGLAMERGDPDVPGTYGFILNEAHPSIAAFGGMFLLMIFLEWLVEDREHFWLGMVERPLNRFGALNGVTVIAALSLLLVVGLAFEEHTEAVLLAGIVGLLTYLVVKGFGELFNKGAEAGLAELEGHTRPGEAVRATGRAAFFLFLYLEVLDASFSFDGVIGAFAITTDPVIIALGLGVGSDVCPLTDDLPGPQGHTPGLRLPRARCALGDRCARRAPSADHRVPHPRGHHRADRPGLHHRRLPVEPAPQPTEP